jgi:hypothetical protein
MDLRDYQTTAIEQIDAASSAIYVLPTGGGKTVIFCKLIEALAAQGQRILIIVRRVEILDQTSYRLQSLGIDHDVIKLVAQPIRTSVFSLPAFKHSREGWAMAGCNIPRPMSLLLTNAIMPERRHGGRH